MSTSDRGQRSPAERLKLGWRRGPVLGRQRRTRRGGPEGADGHAGERRLPKVIVITGFSGAGKSEAMACFEDAGYFCVDNLPPRMISSMFELFEHEGSKVERAAIVSDVRGGEYFEELIHVLDGLERRGLEHEILFLEADEQSLLNRFRETRRRHPLAPTGRVSDGIRAERERLAPIKERADLVIDTSGLSPGALRSKIADHLLPRDDRAKLAVTFVSFGYKYGVPRDADLVFDVRFLPNPHYIPSLREQTGKDAAVREFVEDSDGIDEFYERLVPLLDYLLPAYVTEGKAHLSIAVGCTGGKHRSVAIGEYLASLYRQKEYEAQVVHRDIGR